MLCDTFNSIVHKLIFVVIVLLITLTLATKLMTRVRHLLFSNTTTRAQSINTQSNDRPISTQSNIGAKMFKNINVPQRKPIAIVNSNVQKKKEDLFANDMDLEKQIEANRIVIDQLNKTRPQLDQKNDANLLAQWQFAHDSALRQRKSLADQYNSQYSKTEVTTEAKTMKTTNEWQQRVNELRHWLFDTEMKLRFTGTLTEDEDELNRQIEKHKHFQQEIELQKVNKTDVLKSAKELMEKCDQKGAAEVDKQVGTIETIWTKIDLLVRQQANKLNDHSKWLEDGSTLMERHLAWLDNNLAKLKQIQCEPLIDNANMLECVINDNFKIVDNVEYVKQSVKLYFGGRSQGKKERTRTIHFESEIQNKKAKQVLEKCYLLRKLTLQTNKRFKEWLDFYVQIEKMGSFDEWQQKLRENISNEVAIVLQEKATQFGELKRRWTNLEGKNISNEKTDSSHVDRNDKPKLIDSKTVHNEVIKQLDQCVCKEKYKALQVAQGRYQFGESTQSYLVRIPRYTAIVRFGSGWISLAEFFEKNDPCRSQDIANKPRSRSSSRPRIYNIRTDNVGQASKTDKTGQSSVKTASHTIRISIESRRNPSNSARVRSRTMSPNRQRS